jgi:hypothetical protein
MALLSTVIIGAVNVVCTIVAIVMVDRAGRKALFIQGGVQMIIAEVIVGLLVWKSFDFPNNEALKAAAIAFICLFGAFFSFWFWLFARWTRRSLTRSLSPPRTKHTTKQTTVAGFAWSWGPLGWLVPAGEQVAIAGRAGWLQKRDPFIFFTSPLPLTHAAAPSPLKQTNKKQQRTEVNPIETRSAGCAINTFVNFITTFIIGQFFLSMLCTMQWGVFLFFAGMVLIATLFVVFFIPETKGVPIETLNEVSFAKHWFWKRTVHVHQFRHSVHSVDGGAIDAAKAAEAGAGGVGGVGVGSAGVAKDAVV